MRAGAREYTLQLEVLEPIGDADVVDELVLLHGWGADSRIWGYLIPLLRHRCRILLLDLPGFARNIDSNPWADEVELLDELAEVLPSSAHLLGWSLGGNLALAYAARYPGRVQSLILLACNPSFVAREGWPCGMPQLAFDEFSSAVRRQPLKAMKRFQQLQCKGDALGRELTTRLRKLSDGSTPHSPEALLASLAYLGRVDQRRQNALRGDQVLYILGGSDELVGAALAERLERVVVLPGVAHLPMLSAPEVLAGLIIAELECHPEREAVLRKRRIARSFSHAAATYDTMAGLQRATGAELLGQLGESAQNGCGLDLGCGTGHFLPELRAKRPDLSWLGGDIAEGMLRHTSRVLPAGTAAGLIGLDAEQLPFGDGALQLIYSNLAVQWCQDLDSLFEELARVLKPGGRIVFSSLLSGTLAELKDSWRQVDGLAHVNRFLCEAEWSEAAARAGLVPLQWRRETRVSEYGELRELVQELKALGAHNVNRGRAEGLTGKQSWARLRQAYEQYRLPSGRLPASWQLLYGVLQRG